MSITPAPSEASATSRAADPARREAPTRKELIAYSAAGSAEGMSASVASNLATPILNLEFGINPAQISSILALRTLFDAVTDPIMGQISDNFRSRWGRRRPFIFAGAILVAIIVSLFWWFPTTWSQSAILTWFGIAIFSLAAATTIFSVAHFALGIEIAPSYHERTRVVAYKSFVGKLNQLITPWLYPLCMLPVFVSVITGARVIAIAFSLLTVAAAFWAFKLTHERTAALQNKPKEAFLPAVVRIGKNPNFLRNTGIFALMLSMLALFGTFQLYLNIYYVFGGDKAFGASITAMSSSLGTVIAIASIPLVTWMCKRYQKHVTLRIALSLMLVGDILKWFLLHPETPYAQLALPFCYGLGISSAFIVLGSMQADLVDEDELMSGQRREGLFSCVAAWMMKSAGALATACSGFLINWSGFDVALGTAQSPETIFWLRIFSSFAPATMVATCLILLIGYPLTEARMNEIGEILRKRRDASAA